MTVPDVNGPPKPAGERTKQENEQAKGEALGIALYRRRLYLPDVAHLPETSRGRDRKAPTLAKLARTAYQEAGQLPAYRARWGDPPINPPGSKASESWRHVPPVIADLERAEADHRAAVARGEAPDPPAVTRDLEHERDYWTEGKPCPTSPSTAPDADATSTTTTSTDAAGVPKPAPAAGSDEEERLAALRYSRSLGYCRACEALVRWVDGPNGTTALDREPDPSGGWVVDETTLHGRPAWPRETDRQRWVEHNRVCPHWAGRASKTATRGTDRR